MSAPDFITTIYNPDGAQVVLPVDAPAREYEVAYVRRDPAVLAELPEVRALVAAALQRAADILQLRHSNYMRAKGRTPDDYGSEYSLIAAELLAITPTDHAAALEAVKAQEWNRALEWAAQQTAFMPETIPKSPRAAVHKALDQCDAAIRAGKVPESTVASGSKRRPNQSVVSLSDLSPAEQTELADRLDVLKDQP